MGQTTNTDSEDRISNYWVKQPTMTVRPNAKWLGQTKELTMTVNTEWNLKWLGQTTNIDSLDTINVKWLGQTIKSDSEDRISNDCVKQLTMTVKTESQMIGSNN